MVNRIQQVVCLVRCESAETLRAATEFAERLNHPDTEITRTFVTTPGGVERHEVRTFRIGDYFDQIEARPNESEGDLSLRLTFHIKEGVGSYWKDLLAASLQALREHAPGVKIAIVPGGAKT